MTIIKKNHGYEDSEKVMFQFGRKSWVIIGLYLVLMLQYHFTGARQLNLTPGYLKCMGMVLLVFKLLAELGILDRLVHRQSKQM